jgi:hypothetical protein
MQQKVTTQTQTQTQRRKTTLQVSRNLTLDHYDERKPLQISRISSIQIWQNHKSERKTNT